MSRFVRSSKVRHVFGEALKHEQHYTELRLSSSTGDHNYIKCNEHYFAVSLATGGGSLGIFPLDQPGKLPPKVPVIDGHKGAIFDFEFSPFHQSLIATGGDDCTVKLWQIPVGGLTENLVQPLVNMSGHQKKVNLMRFHPTADNVLATGSADHTVKVWDVQSGDCKLDVSCNQLVQEVVWNYDGSILATSSKDKMMRFFDPRSGEVTSEVEAHNGAKTSKLVFLGSSGRLASVGFTRQSKRQLKIWDPKNMAAPLATCDIDQSAGSFMPFYDDGTSILYLPGKGDANMRYFECVDHKPWQYKIADFRGGKPAKGMAMMPKRTVDVMHHEVAKFLKLTSSSVEPISFTCPRKSELFQEDIFPACYAGKAAMTADEFFGGKNANPVLMSMNPEDCASGENKENTVQQETFVVKKSATELQQELSVAQKYIEILKKALEDNKVDVPPAPKTA
eukprot:CAMPEP_0204826972 /NCGR_PEP_ID=MMETSP1346-20131115/4553_1 /ASSEMBLY_ACC=CAM_ASM_000771 /TAXON_ID=215587 /ORGANISM="Aplanochytrium stocchinoi, Strain GSBS06" /LENGTH=448 /DNA_ID=CAMNT_0051955231 /DNA_START=197 /DNA_END=1543 /DNA_ORIENTATION=+